MANENEGPGVDFEPIGPTAAADAAKKARAAELDREAPHVGDFLKESLALMKARASGDAKPIPLPWPDVAEALGGGLWPGLHVLTGATGQGKTQLALQVAWAAAGADVPVLYVGLELGKLDVTARLLALAEGEATKRTPKWSAFYLGKVAPAELERLVSTHAAAIAGRPFRAEFGPPHGWGSDRLVERVRAMREECSDRKVPLLVVLDYLQAVGNPEGERFDLRERIGKAAYVSRAVAREFDAAVLVLSSVARENAKRCRVSSDDGKDGGVTPGETPASELVGLGKESGEIEYAADSVMALVSGEFDPREKVTPTWLAVAKVRAGRPGWCSLEFDGATFREGLTT